MGLFSRSPYPLLAAGSLAWHMSRWGTAFSASLFLSHEGSAVLSQGVGALLWVPMLVGGFFGGLLSDLYDVKRLVVGTQWCCQPRLRRYSALYGLLRPGPHLVVPERTSFAQQWETNRSPIRSSGRLRAILVVVGAAVRWPEPWRSISTPDDSIAA